MLQRSWLWVLSGAGGVLAAGYGVMFTLLDDFRDEYGIQGAGIGLIIGIGFVTSFLSQLLLAPQADRGHSRALVRSGFLLSVVGMVVMALGRDLPVLLVGRIIGGIGVGMAIPAVRRIVILANPEEIGSNMGRLLSADVAGFALGPVVSAFVAPLWGIAAPFWVMAVATAAFIPLLETVHFADVADPPKERLALDLLRIRPFAASVVMGSAVFIMIGTFDSLWSLAMDDLRAPDLIASLGITLFALPLVVLGAPGGRFVQRIGPFRGGALGLTLGSLFMIAYGWLPTAGLMFAVAMFHALSDGLTVTATSVAAGMVVPDDRQAGAQGLLGGVQVLVAGLTAFLMGTLYESSGRGLAYTVCGAIMLTLTLTGLWLAGPQARMRGADRHAVAVAVAA